MAEQATEQEPTMEEILASIRRIISEDEEPAEPSPLVLAEPETRRAPEPARRSYEPPRGRDRGESLERTSTLDRGSLDRTSRMRPPAPPALSPALDDDIAFEEAEIMPAGLKQLDEDHDLVSEPVANAAASAFGELVGQMLVSSRSTEGKTLEDIVRELVKPMLREWLDANLRAIVEARVASEVERISARARGR